MKVRLLRGGVLIVSGAVAAYFLDPDNGRARRKRSQEQLAAARRRKQQAADRKARYREGQLKGASAQREGAGQPHPVDDRAVADELRQVLGRMDFSTSDVTVDVVDGVAAIRGQVDTVDHMKKVELEACDAPGVREVKSYLHLPGTPAPNKAAALNASAGE